MSEEQVNIEPSKLGTKEYWDERYEMELGNYKDCGDEGEIWFGVSAENRICKYLNENAPHKKVKILDLGCGNGSVLRKLRSKGFEDLYGIDYCSAAIDLSKSISVEDAEENDYATEIIFDTLDLLKPEDVTKLKCKFNYILDKGTWDAMSLSEDRGSRCEAYLNTVLLSLVPGGRLVIFSCNFTRNELESLFNRDDFKFEFEIPSVHTISFGGKQGVTSTGVVFQKKE